MKNNGICYCFIEERGGNYALTFSTVKKGIHTGIEIGIIDFSKKEKLKCSEYVLNSHISRLSSFSVNSKNFELSLEDCGNEKIIKADFEKCLAHTALKAQLKIFLTSPKLENGEESIGFVGACGEVLVKGRKYVFENGSLGAFFTANGIPEKSRLIAYGKEADGVAAVSGKDGKLVVLKNEQSFSFENFKISEGKFGENWSISADGGAKLSFLPVFNDRVDVSRPWLNLHGNLFYGRLSGSSFFEENEIAVNNIKCLYGIADN